MTSKTNTSGKAIHFIDELKEKYSGKKVTHSSLDNSKNDFKEITGDKKPFILSTSKINLPGENGDAKKCVINTLKGKYPWEKTSHSFV